MAVVAHCDPGSRAHPSADQTSAFVRRWDPEILRAARRQAKLGASLADADDFAQEARIRLARIQPRRGDAPAPYLRKVIANAVLAAAQPRRVTAPTGPLDAEAENLATETPESDLCAIRAVSAWVRELPARLQDIYRLLYCEERSQSEAAGILGVSQPRVAQLHRLLLTEGRKRFDSLAVAA
jgi:RNA polymerase sigma factor (sigma-70 family)